MTASDVRDSRLEFPDRSRLLRAGLFTGISDGLFACALAPTLLHITVTRLWQGVASVLIGPSAIGGGGATALLGVAMHFGVAFGWSTVLYVLVGRSPWLRGVLRSPFGVFKVAAVYGPSIWLVMSLVVIPLLVRRAPALTLRWLVQWIGHAPFVGFPMTEAIAGGWTRSPERSGR